MLYLDKSIDLVEKGPEELRKLLEHPLIFGDFGFVGHLAVVVVFANLVECPDGTHAVKCRIISKLFGGKGAYV
jgi:hypothetical protein